MLQMKQIYPLQVMPLALPTRVSTKISMIYINDIYHDIFDIFDIFKTSIFIIIIYLLFLIHACLTQTAQVPKLLDGAKILRKILTLLVGLNNITDHRHRRTAHAIKRT